MEKGASASEPQLVAAGRPFSWAARVPRLLRGDQLVAVLVVLLGIAWVSEGLRTLLGLPHAVVGVIDLAEACLCGWLAFLLLRERRIRLLVLVALYSVWVLIGVAWSSAPDASVLTAVKDALLLPLLAAFLLTREASERGARILVAGLVGLCLFEVLLSLGQYALVPGATHDPDLVVGTFGGSSNAIIGVVVTLTSCLAIAGYLIGARYAKLALCAAVVLPLSTTWVFDKIVVVLFPLVALLVIATGLILRKTDWRRAAVAMLASLVSSGLVIGSYAVWRPDSFNALFSAHAIENYAVAASSSGSSSGSFSWNTAARSGTQVIEMFGNSHVAVANLRSGAIQPFVVGNLKPGGYSAWFPDPSGGNNGWFPVEVGRRYSFSAAVLGAARVPQAIDASIEWVNANGTPLAQIASGRTFDSPAVGSETTFQIVTVNAKAPSRARFAVPIVAVQGSPPAGSWMVARSPRFAVVQSRQIHHRVGTARPATPRHRSARTHHPASSRASPGGSQTTSPSSAASSSGQLSPLPGHLTLLRMAADGVSSSVGTALFGNGTGTATVAAALGVGTRKLSKDAAAASYSDAGTVLFERGWVGICIYLLIGLLIVIAAVRLLRNLPAGQWKTALVVAVPGVVGTMAAFTLIGTPLQNRSAALTFWLLVGVGLAPAVVRLRPSPAADGDVPSGGVTRRPPQAVRTGLDRIAVERERLVRWLRRPSLESLVVIGFLIFGILIRLSQLRRPMSYDEAYTFDTYALGSVGSIVSTYIVPNNQIFYTLLTHFAWKVVGTHIWTVRLVAFISGCLMVPVAYAVGRDLYGRRAGLWAAGLIATSAPLVDYSVDGRGYILGTLLVVVLLWLALKLLSASRLRTWAAFVVCAALAIYTVPVMLTGVAIVVLWVGGVTILRRPRNLRFLLWLASASACAALLAFVLYIPALGQPGWSYITPVPAEWSLVRPLALGVWDNWNRAGPHILDLIVGLAFLLSVVVHRWIARHPLPLVVPTLVVLGAIFLFGPISPFWRSWLCLLPFYLIPAGAGLSWLATQAGRLVRLPAVINSLAAVGVTAVLGIAILHVGQIGAEEPPDTDNSIVGLIKHDLLPGETVAFQAVLETPDQYYFLKDSYTPPAFAPRALHRGVNHVLVVLYGDPGSPAALTLLNSLGVKTLTDPHVTLAQRRQYISIYQVSFDYAPAVAARAHRSAA